MENDALAAALDHLRDFRAKFSTGSYVDEGSRLTADDLDTILAAAQPKTDLEPGGSLTMDDLAGAA